MDIRRIYDGKASLRDDYNIRFFEMNLEGPSIRI